MAKEKKQSTIVTGFDTGTEILQGPKLHKHLFDEVVRKFNPENLVNKII